MAEELTEALARVRAQGERAARLAEDEQRRRMEQLELLATSLERIGAAVDLEGAMEALLRGAVALLRAEHGLARLVDRVKGERIIEMVLSRDGRLAVGRELGPPEAGSYGAQLLAGAPPAIVDDYETADHERYPLREQILGAGMRSAVHVPIDARGVRTGNLSVNHSRPGFFGPQDVAMAMGLASKAGAVIERARQDEAVRAAHDQLRETARMDGALLVVRAVAHEVNNALAPVLGFAELLAASPEVAGTAHLAGYAAAIVEGAAEAAEKVARLQRITRLEETRPLAGVTMLDLERSAPGD